MTGGSVATLSDLYTSLFGAKGKREFERRVRESEKKIKTRAQPVVLEPAAAQRSHTYGMLRARTW